MFALFIYEPHDARGGWHDLCSVHDTLEEAKREFVNQEGLCGNIADLYTLKMVAWWRPPVYGQKQGEWVSGELAF